MIAVTGATGELGGRVARGLAALGAPQRLIVRDPARAPRLAHTEVVVRALVRRRSRIPRRAARRRHAVPRLGTRVDRPRRAALLGDHRGARRRRRADRLHVVPRRGPGRDLHVRARPLPHRAAHPGDRHPLHLPARQPVPRLRPVPRRRRRRDPGPGGRRSRGRGRARRRCGRRGRRAHVGRARREDVRPHRARGVHAGEAAAELSRAWGVPSRSRTRPSTRRARRGRAAAPRPGRSRAGSRRTPRSRPASSITSATPWSGSRGIGRSRSRSCWRVPRSRSGRRWRRLAAGTSPPRGRDLR